MKRRWIELLLMHMLRCDTVLAGLSILAIN